MSFSCRTRVEILGSIGNSETPSSDNRSRSSLRFETPSSSVRSLLVDDGDMSRYTTPSSVSVSVRHFHGRSPDVEEDDENEVDELNGVVSSASSDRELAALHDKSAKLVAESLSSPPYSQIPK